MRAPRRYGGRTSSRGGGIGLVPIILLAILGVFFWKTHGAHVPDLRAFLP